MLHERFVGSDGDFAFDSESKGDVGDAKWIARDDPGRFIHAASSQVLGTPHGDAHVQSTQHPKTGDCVFTSRARDEKGKTTRPMHVRIAAEHMKPDVLEAEAQGKRRVAATSQLPREGRAQAHALALQLEATAAKLRARSDAAETTPAGGREDATDVEDARSAEAKAAWKASGALDRQVDLEQSPEDHLEAARLHRAAAEATPTHATTHNEKAAYHEQMAARLGEPGALLQRTAAKATEAAEGSAKAADHVAAAKAWRAVEAHPQTTSGMRGLSAANAEHHEQAAEGSPDWEEAKHPRDENGRFT